MNCNETLIPRELKENDYHLNLVAADLTNDNSAEAEPYIKKIKEITQNFLSGDVAKYTALNQIHNELVYYDQQENNEQKGQEQEQE